MLLEAEKVIVKETASHKWDICESLNYSSFPLIYLRHTLLCMCLVLKLEKVGSKFSIVCLPSKSWKIYWISHSWFCGILRHLRKSSSGWLLCSIKLDPFLMSWASNHFQPQPEVTWNVCTLLDGVREQKVVPYDQWLPNSHLLNPWSSLDLEKWHYPSLTLFSAGRYN